MSKGRRNRTWEKTESLIRKIESDSALLNSNKGENGVYKCCGYHDCICVVFPNAGGQEVPVAIRTPINVEI